MEALGMKMNILCATSGVGNAGIDCRDARVVYRIDFPPSYCFQIDLRVDLEKHWTWLVNCLIDMCVVLFLFFVTS